MKHLYILISAIVIAATVLVIAPASFAATDPFEDACKITRDPGSGVPDACEPDGSDPIGGTDGILMTVTNTIALLAGITSVIIIVIASLQFVVAAGDSTKIANARKAIIYAIVGIVFIIAARSVIAFVVTEL